MTREFAHPSSLTTQPEEKLKAQPIFAAKLLLRRKIGGAVGKGLEQQHTGAASLTPTVARPDPAVCSILLRYSAAKPSPPQSRNVTPPKPLGADYVANILLPAAVAVTSKHLSRSRLFLKGSWDSFRERRHHD